MPKNKKFPFESLVKNWQRFSVYYSKSIMVVNSIKVCFHFSALAVFVLTITRKKGEQSKIVDTSGSILLYDLNPVFALLLNSSKSVLNF